MASKSVLAPAQTEKPRPRGRGLFICAKNDQSALTRLEALLDLVDDVNATLATNQLVVAMAVAQRLQRITDLHLSSPEVLANKRMPTGRSPQPNVEGLCPIFSPGSMGTGGASEQKAAGARRKPLAARQNMAPFWIARTFPALSLRKHALSSNPEPP